MYKDSILNTLRRFTGSRYILVLEGVVVGIFAGLAAVLFRAALSKGGELLNSAADFGRRHPAFIPVWFCILLAAAGLVTLLLKWEPYISGSGIPQVEGEMHGHFDQKWWRVLLAKFFGGLITISSGLALGREGPSIQLGAMAGKGVSRIGRRGRTEEKLLMTCGASAGLAAAFNAPLAGILFSLEEVHKNFSIDVLLSAMASSITAAFLSRNVFGLDPVFDFTGISAIPLRYYWVILVLGVLLGLFGILYNFCIPRAQAIFDKIKIKYLKTVIPFILAGIFAFTYPAALGGGHEIILSLCESSGIRLLIILLIIRFSFSVLSFSSGVPGGIFLPLLVLGAVAGSIAGGIADIVGISLNVNNFIVLGMAGFFAAVVRAPITGSLLICEMSGSLTNMLPVALVSLAAYAIADLLHSKPIYDQLLHRMLVRGGSDLSEKSENKVMVNSPVHIGAPICGRKISEIDWPAEALVVSVKRGSKEIVPKGNTVISAGDEIVVLCDEPTSRDIYQLMQEQCQSMVIKD